MDFEDTLAVSTLATMVVDAPGFTGSLGFSATVQEHEGRTSLITKGASPVFLTTNFALITSPFTTTPASNSSLTSIVVISPTFTPLLSLFKDEVRRIGKTMGMDPELLGRHPFPGPGLGIRILGEVTAERVKLLQEADAIFIQALKSRGLYDEVWQAGVILLPVQTVGVMGDERTYEHAVALRAVTSTDGMTADWCHLPYDFLAEVSNKIINQVKGINRVTYDISSKPPATIEWE